MKTNLPKIGLFICVTLSFLLAACGVAAPPATSTATVTKTRASTDTPTIVPTVTFTPTITPSPTATPNFIATEQYDEFYSWVEKFADEGLISSINGKYYPLENYSKPFAKLGYYTWVAYDPVETTNFMIQARVKIENATMENTFKSACGFVFEDFFSNHAIFFALDGNANYRTNGMDRGSKYLDSSLLQNPEGVTLTLLLHDKALRFYVNDRLALSGITIYGGPFKAGPSILSGTSEGFGTRCDFTEMVLWQMD